VWKKGSALVPSFVAFAVVQLLELHFGRLVDYGFTASVEEDLDRIASGDRHRVDWLTRFYFGATDGVEGGIARAGGLRKMVAENLGDIDARGVNSIPLFKDEQDRDVVVRVGRYGPYIQAGGDEGDRVSLPEDVVPDELTPERVAELLSAPSDGRTLGTDPANGHELIVRAGRYGPYVTEVLPEGDESKPRTGSLFASMSPESVTLEDALLLLSLPRALGFTEGGEEITAQNGRYGPYIKAGKESRSLGSEPELFTVTLEQALALLAQPKTRGRAAAKPPLRELGEDPVSGQRMVIKEGRFGPYVTDGETNASLRKGDEITTISDERASELLADRRARGPVKKTARKTAAKKAPAKTAAAKSTAKKTVTKAAKTPVKKTTTAAKKTAAKKAARPKK
jgi:DNA topoisomerase-1